MKKVFKTMMSAILVMTMLMPAAQTTAYAASSGGIQNIYADFEGLTTVGQTTTAYGATTTVNSNGKWKGKIEPAAASDANGSPTTALHTYWYDTGNTSTASSWDTMWNIQSLDLTGSTLISFDIMFDNSISDFRLQYRYKHSSATSKTLCYIKNSNTSESTILGQSISSFGFSVKQWYHFTMAVSFDSQNEKVTGKAWINGSEVVSNGEVAFGSATADNIGGTSENYLRFVTYYNSKTASGNVPGVWIDNIMFSKSGSSHVVTAPKSGEKIDGNTARLIYGAYLDGLDKSDITVTKDGKNFSPAEIKIYNNVIEIKLTDELQAPNGEYTVTVPDGTRDIAGNLLSAASRTFTFRSGEPAVKSFALVSPSDGAVTEKDMELIIKAESSSLEGADVHFYVNDSEITDVTAHSDGTYTASWTPAASGIYSIRATAVHDGEVMTSAAEKIRVLGSAKWSSNWRNVYANSNPASQGDGTAVASGYTTNSVTFKRTQDSAPYTRIYNSSVSTGYTKGVVVAEAEFIPEKNSAVNISNRNAGDTNNSQTAVSLNSGKVYYRQGTKSIESDVTYEEGKKQHVKTVWDLEDEKIYIYLNNEQLPFISTMRSNWTNIYELRFNVDTAKSADGPSATIQNEKVSYYPPTPKLSNVSVKNTEGAALAAGEISAANAAYIEAVYDEALNAGTVTSDNIKLYRGSGNEAEIAADIALIGTNTITVTPKSTSHIVPSAEYRLELSYNITSADGVAAENETAVFRTVADLGAENGIFKVGGAAVSSLSQVQNGDTVTFTADISDGGTWVVMVLFGSNDSGKYVKNIKISLCSGIVSGSLSITSAIEDGDVMYAYILDDSFNAVSDEFHISQ